jgi:hypothetical protein
MHRALSILGAAAVSVVATAALRAQSLAPRNGDSSFTGIGRASPDRRIPFSIATAGVTGSHRMRTAGIVGAAIGLAAGVAGGSMLAFGDVEGRSSAANGQLRGITYLGASGAVAGWIVGTTVALPFRGHNEVGPHDVRNATITGSAVGFMTGIAAGSLMGFKCDRCSAATSSIPVTGLIGAAVGAVVGRGIGLILPHQRSAASTEKRQGSP